MFHHLFNHGVLKNNKKLHKRDNRLKFERETELFGQLGDFLSVCVGVANTETGTVFGCGGNFCVSGELTGSLQMNQKTR